MPPHPGPTLRKVTLNLYEEDCVLLERYVGQGWTTVVREWIHDATFRQAKPKTVLQKLTIGDLP